MCCEVKWTNMCACINCAIWKVILGVYGEETAVVWTIKLNLTTSYPDILELPTQT